MHKLSLIFILLSAFALYSCTSAQHAGSSGRIVEYQPSLPNELASTKQVGNTALHTSNDVVYTPLPAQPTRSPTPYSIEFSKYTTADIQMQASNLRRKDEYKIVDVCYGTPDRNDWQITHAMYQFGDQQVSVESETLGEMQPLAEDREKGYRCTELYFVVPSTEDISTSVVRIGAVREFLLEGTGCERYLNEVKMALEKLNISIQFDCYEDHGYNIEITKIPDNMTEDEALRLLDEYYTVKGNWVFTFEE